MSSDLRHRRAAILAADVADADAIVDAIRGCGGSERAREIARQNERWLATVLFTDIVGSTECNRY